MEAYLGNILFSIVGIFFILISFFIFRKKSVSILAEYDSKKNYCAKNLLNWTGSSFLIAGLLIIIISIIGWYFTFINISVIFGITIALLAIIIGIGFNKYEID
ncbi:hypothetical protein [Clostridium massiliamazoniense]|uniref:hypothetical protein n=1 Tax=Clostridium massiliamazoniense TaxID=1347366 RepID=UPI0006D79379|nr:hypothetical protein [Clostridium massiliamazoniense]